MLQLRVAIERHLHAQMSMNCAEDEGHLHHMPKSRHRLRVTIQQPHVVRTLQKYDIEIKTQNFIFFLIRERKKRLNVIRNGFISGLITSRFLAIDRISCYGRPCLFLFSVFFVLCAFFLWHNDLFLWFTCWGQFSSKRCVDVDLNSKYFLCHRTKYHCHV